MSKFGPELKYCTAGRKKKTKGAKNLSHTGLHKTIIIALKFISWHCLPSACAIVSIINSFVIK